MPTSAKPAESKLLPKWLWLMAITLRGSNLPSMAIKVALWLADYANEYGQAWPARTTLAKLLRCTERTIGTALAALRDDGWITPLVERVGPGVRQQWQLNWNHRKEISCDGLNDNARRRVAKVLGKHGKETAQSQARTSNSRGQKDDLIAGRNLHTIPLGHTSHKSCSASLPAAFTLRADAFARLTQAMRAKPGLLERLADDQYGTAIEAEAVDFEQRSPGTGIAVVMDRLNWSPQTGQQ